MSQNDDWVQVALTDDAVVADLIVRLRQPLPCKRKGKAPAPAMEMATLCPRWTVRQQRSKQVVIKKKAGESPLRASPTTPLSWSEATSVSGGGAEESSCFVKSLPAAATSEERFSKRGRKRKQTVADLQAVESSLLNENIILKSELERLHSDVEKVRAVNATLKIMTANVLSRHMMETFTAASASKQVALNQSRQPVILAQDPTYSMSQGVACIKLDQCHRSSEGAMEPSFVLPDLNLPVDESGFDG
ncbi:hypothetical protein HS088_TW10G00764 [Tripterygium wilfordii]|uniref:Uncharacterized protein n=1 Tax=Tripterygium wilfordii TaxID=458696 RepID=A0A7J7D626_TRIWF|nr:uncharacterized protein LOC120007161 isoform X1 [Tripterygium wilfordii]KAF5741758.1 hypothetical protein HS088_TW10G00764 [Tripterygium wilfordii]